MLSLQGLQQRFSTVFPTLSWLPEYQWKRDLHNDIKAGLGKLYSTM